MIAEHQGDNQRWVQRGNHADVYALGHSIHQLFQGIDGIIFADGIDKGVIYRYAVGNTGIQIHAAVIIVQHKDIGIQCIHDKDRGSNNMHLAHADIQN